MECRDLHLVFTLTDFTFPGLVTGCRPPHFKCKSVLKVALSQKVQDSFFNANFAIINIPKNYLKLLHPLHSIDKMSIFKTFTFTCVVYLQVQEVGFMSSTNNFIS